MAVLHYKDPATGEWIPIVTGPKGPKGDKGDAGGVAGPPGTPGATTHAALTDLALQNNDHPQYLKAAGDFLEGALILEDETAEFRYLIGGVEKFAMGVSLPDALNIFRYTSPGTLDTIVSFKTNGDVWIGDEGKVDLWKTLNVHDAAVFSSIVNFVNGANMGDRKVTGVATPTVATDAANKAYVDGVGGIMGLSENVATGTGNHWLNGAGSPLVWGGLNAGSDYLQAMKAGWYRCSFNGVFGTSPTGTIRQMRLAVNLDGEIGIPPGANHIGASTTPNSWGGWGLPLSASGIWHMDAGRVIRLMARHDAGAALQATGTITMELVKAD